VTESADPSRGRPRWIRPIFVSLSIVPIYTVAALLTTGAGQVLATRSLATGSEPLTQAAYHAWRDNHFILLVVLQSALVIPAVLFVAFRLAHLTRAKVGLGLDRPIPIFLLGCVGGLAVILLPSLIGYWSGGIELVAPPAGATVHGLDALPAVLFLLPGLMVAAFSEELVLRGFLLRYWQRSLGTVPAVLATASLFAVMHMWNPSASLLGAIGAFIAGVWLGMAFVGSGNLLLVTGLHLGWNAGITVVLGLPMSGIPAAPSLAVLAPTSGDTAQMLWGGAYGPEEGVAFHMALTAAVLASLVLAPLLRQAPRGSTSSD